MSFRAPKLILPAACLLALAGCAGVSTENSESGSPENAVATTSSSETGSESSAKAISSSESSATKTAGTSSTSDGPKSTWRTEREARAAAASGSTGSSTSTGSSGGGTRTVISGDSAKLVEQLNEASRELATLRTANAKLRAQVSQPSRTSPSQSVKSDPADEKLAASIKSYASFKQEMVNLFSEIERVRQENAGMSSNLKAAVAQSDQARAALTKLEAELRAEKKSRAEAEAAVSQLREQLRAVARALNAAGLSVDKLTASAESGGKR